MGLQKVRGSCLCGEIVYEVDVVAEQILSCHCTRCQKAHGAAFATQAFARGETLVFLKGESFLHEYKTESGSRSFCSICGSRLMNFAENKADYLSVALACVDGETDLKPAANICIETKAAWHVPSSTPPSFEGFPKEIPQ